MERRYKRRVLHERGREVVSQSVDAEMEKGEQEVNGAYFSHGDLRQIALSMAIDSTDEFGTQNIVDRAEAYFQFLVADQS